MRKERIVVAMSGGVDSSVAAYLLKKKGYDVIGVTMCFSRDVVFRRRPSCCGIEGIEDAKRVCEKLGIAHYVLNFAKPLQEKVIDNFCREYAVGRTPNPCVRCNQFLKFDILFGKARQMDAQFLATGHYARIVWQKNTGRYLLKKGKDRHKDQSYFLYGINKKSLPFILMPLGNYTKHEVREIARGAEIKVADKPGSQEICFVPGDYRAFLKERLSAMGITMKAGPIIDTSGKVLGRHDGIGFYTLGQREGLGIALGYRAYVVKIDPATDTIVLGRDDSLYSRGLITGVCNFVSGDFPRRAIRAKVKIRYNHKEILGRLIPLDRRRLRVEFLKPQRAVTPGQSAVFYDRDIVLGGAEILAAV